MLYYCRINKWSRILHDVQTSTETLENIFHALHNVSPEDPLRRQFYKLIARHSNAPFAALETELRLWEWGELAAAVAENPNAPAVILENLVEYYTDTTVRRNIALNPATPRRILKLLAEEYDEVRYNPSLARELDAAIESASRDDIDIEEVLELSQSPFPEIRTTIAKNSKTPTTILEQLAQDKNWYVRAAIAVNPNTPVFVLAKLAGDRDPDE
jgi:hypothetical protein